MDRFEHCMVEFYWTPPAGAAPGSFKPSFSVFHPDGRQEPHEGSNPELAVLFSRLGAEGWRVATAVSSSNWILWTLERKLG
ncbi:MAG: hypothetical protein KF764_23080 [Labilithrix sp.]|nr:hypothetical protein [Labilithrix sp.]MBX3221278.1 hypothetical protein [Labilithrix sp.]